MRSTQVLIAGAGPVGLSLAADLAWRGVSSLLLEPQVDVHPHPRAISVGVRTMEHFRRLGLEQAAIEAGVPRSRVLDVVYVTRVLQREIFRFRMPSIDDLFRDRARLEREIPETAASPYYKCWTAQSPLEKALRSHLARTPGVELRLGWRLQSFEESESGVTVQALEDSSGRVETLTASYLAGCDGANSTVRAGLGIRLEGQGTLGRARGIYFRAPDLDERLGRDRGVMYWTLARGCAGVFYTIDGADTWVFNRYPAPGEPDNAPARELIRRALGDDVPIEILSDQEWLPRQLVAERYSSRRVFLAGDACHLFVPTGGFGMNTGIGDAVDLAWKIAAVEAGWGGPRLLASYDAERRPVGTFNTLEAADNYRRGGDIFAVPDGLEEEGARGEGARAAVAAKLPPKIKHFAPIGVHLGYRYEGSPIVAPDGSPEPPTETASYTPTARPGHRAPHAWISPGRSTLDLFGRGFVLLRFAQAKNDGALQEAAMKSGVPFEAVDLDDPVIASLYGRRLVLVRPDGHVAWRGDDEPSDPGALIARITGA